MTVKQALMGDILHREDVEARRLCWICEEAVPTQKADVPDYTQGACIERDICEDCYSDLEQEREDITERDCAAYHGGLAPDSTYAATEAARGRRG